MKTLWHRFLHGPEIRKALQEIESALHRTEAAGLQQDNAFYQALQECQKQIRDLQHRHPKQARLYAKAGQACARDEDGRHWTRMLETAREAGKKLRCNAPTEENR